MVCMGNICRSPSAEGMARHKLNERGLGHRVEVDSAGTYAGHAGHEPDHRAQDAALKRGIIIAEQRARGVQVDDFYQFDLILAMDQSNYSDLLNTKPKDAKAAVEKIMGYSTLGVTDDVPDPYYGGRHGFEQVLDLLDNAIDGLLEKLEADLKQRDISAGITP